METVFEYRIVCSCHGPLVSGLTKEQAETTLDAYLLDKEIQSPRIEFRRVTYTEWKPEKVKCD